MCLINAEINVDRFDAGSRQKGSHNSGQTTTEEVWKLSLSTSSFPSLDLQLQARVRADHHH